MLLGDAVLPSSAHTGLSADEKDDRSSVASAQDPSSSKREAIAAKQDAVEGREPTSYPWRYQGRVLVLVLSFNLGTYWFSSALGPLKSIIKRDLGINNAAYGVLASSNHLVNTAVPVLSGVLIDYYGAECCSLTAASTMLLGAILSGIGATLHSYGLLVAGEVIVGLGSITMQTSQLKILSFWFYANHLGLVYGCENAMNRVTVGLFAVLCASVVGPIDLCRHLPVAAKATAIPIAEAIGWIWVIWIAAFLSLAVWIVNAYYYIWERSLPSAYRPVTGRQSALQYGSGGFKSEVQKAWSVVKSLSGFFWVLTLGSLLQHGVVQTYIQLQADMIKQTRGTTLSTAGWMTAVGQAPIIMIAPLLGLFFDTFGCRMHLVPVSAALFLLCFSLMRWTSVNGVVLTVIQGLGMSVNVLPFTISIPLLVQSISQVGTAEGTFQAFINSGSVIISAAAGALQDLTPTGRHTYNNVLYLFMGLKAFDFFIGSFFIWFDRRHVDGVLSQAEKDQRALGESAERRARYKDPIRGWTVAGVTVGLAMTITAWVVYLVYSQGS